MFGTKRQDLLDFLKNFKEKNKINYENTNLPIQKLYDHYVKQKKKLVFSKRYMKKFLEKYFYKYIVNEKCIDSQLLFNLDV